jgi:hypothetical protein
MPAARTCASAAEHAEGREAGPPAYGRGAVDIKEGGGRRRGGAA